MTAAVDTEIESNPHISDYFRRTVAKYVSHVDPRRSLQVAHKAVKTSLSDLSTTGTAEVKGGNENAPKSL